MPDELEWRRVSASPTSRDGKQWPFVTPMDLLRFKPLPPLARVRLGAAVLALQQRPATARRSRTSPRASGSSATWAGRLARAVGPAAARQVRRARRRRSRWSGCGASCGCGADRRRRARGEARLPARTRGSRCSHALQERIEARRRARADRPPGRAARRAGDGFAVTPGAPDSFRARPRPARVRRRSSRERYDARAGHGARATSSSRLLEPGAAARGGLPARGRAASSTSRRCAC